MVFILLILLQIEMIKRGVIVIIEPSIELLLKRVDSRYTLCILIAKRTKQLMNGANKLVECSSNKEVSIAVNEINEGMITYVRTKSRIK